MQGLESLKSHLKGPTVLSSELNVNKLSGFYCIPFVKRNNLSVHDIDSFFKCKKSVSELFMTLLVIY